MKTHLEQAMDCTVNMYHQYCVLDPVDDFLHFREFQKLMKEQAQPFLKRTTPPNMSQDAYLQKLFNRADRDRNNYLKYTEWMSVFGALLNDAHSRSHILDDDHKTGKPLGDGHCH